MQLGILDLPKVGKTTLFNILTASDAATAASHPAWWLLTACGGVVLVLGLVATSSRADASARRTAAVLNPEALPAS